ncbi:hypothetical protein NC652_025615 [Populus alba x Populus x berolinensis]|nr:hypothetical protein NC652_025615 [Populus alba x Populus x berolinensis]
MGNYISCTLATPLMKNSREVRQFREPVKAAEIMLECPNFFLANSQSLHIGRRFSALSADEELESGNAYLMFPMKRVSSVVTAADMAVFFIAANSAAKRISGGNSNRVLPESGGDQNVQESIEGSENGAARLSLEGEYKYRLSCSRSRKPMLETIKEEPVRLR